MGFTPFLVSLAVGAGVGVIYGLLNVRAPAPPIVALFGLLGMLLGEGLVCYLRGHPGVTAQIMHVKNFAPDASSDQTPPGGAPS